MVSDFKMALPGANCASPTVMRIQDKVTLKILVFL